MPERHPGIGVALLLAGLLLAAACWFDVGSAGAAAWLAQELMRYAGHLPIWALEACVAIITLLFAQVISHVGAAVMMVPIAINIALAAGGNPAAFAIVVAISTSNTFIIPGASPTILIVAGPGGYTTRDFLRVGLPLTALMLVVMLVCVNLLFH